MASVALVLVCAVLVVAPLGGALRCYQCADSVLSSSFVSSLPGLDKALKSSAVVPCSQFDKSSERFQTECHSVLAIAGVKAGCVKTFMGNVTIRNCAPIVAYDGCQEEGDVGVCYCEGDLCNSAGVPAPALLPLLAVPLLAGRIAT